MRISRIHLPILSDEFTDQLTISGDKAHYLRNVLRLKAGRTLVFFTQDHKEFEAQIESVQRHDVLLHQIIPSSNPTPAASVQTTLIQAISSGDRMDYTVQKAAEMGATDLIPVFSEHCSQKIPVNKYDKKQAHWQAIANSACEQSGRCDLLQIHPIQSLNEVLDEHVEFGIFLEPTVKEKISNLPNHLQNKQSVFIGPEGGFSDQEINLFKEKGLFGVQLGQRVLRTETATPVIMAAIHTLFGDFK